MSDVKICEPGGQGLLLPLFSFEEDISDTPRGLMYLFMLLYMFMGVNVVADYFMSAVEVITGSSVRKWLPDENRYVTVDVWNPTVANLTLLALGSSAPEILLSILEMFSAEFYAGALGPSTIVGSAAFNLLVIIAVCVISIPEGESRRIKEMPVYHITVIFSIAAYMWLLCMCTVISPNVVEIWEASVTLLMMPMLVAVSYLADAGFMPAIGLDPKSLTPTRDAEEESAKAAAPVHPRISKAHDTKRGSATTLAKAAHHSLGEERRDSLGKDGDSKEPTAVNPAPAEGADGAVTLPRGDNGKLICDLREPEKQPIVNPAGVLTFRSDTLEIKVGSDERAVSVTVLRRNGTTGEVTCRYRTTDFDAVPDFDYEEVSDELKFAEGEESKEIKLKILPKNPYEINRSFQLHLEEATGGAIFNPNDDGEEEKSIVTVFIVNELKGPSNCNEHIDRRFNYKKIRWGLVLWKEQIRGAFELGGGDDEELEEGAEPAKPGIVGYIDYVVSMPWRVLFALMSPPAIWAGGWILFTAALCLIACVTAMICDLAGLFGCCMGLEESVTAITVVALGTSLPDMFASMTSAMKDEYADASIVNVTGSNSVNVFLGIGIPWTICSFYWQGTIPGPDSGVDPGAIGLEWRAKYPKQYADYPKGVYVVPAGSLGFSVFVFCCCSAIALVILRVRRLKFGGELGGARVPKFVSFGLLICCWLTYVMASIWRSASDDADVLYGPLGAMAFIATVGCIFFDIGIRMDLLKTVPFIEDEVKPKEEVDEATVKLVDQVETPKADDGEPPATVGKPLLEEELTNQPTGEGEVQDAPNSSTESAKVKKKKVSLKSRGSITEEDKNKLMVPASPEANASNSSTGSNNGDQPARAASKKAPKTTSAVKAGGAKADTSDSAKAKPPTSTGDKPAQKAKKKPPPPE